MAQIIFCCSLCKAELSVDQAQKGCVVYCPHCMAELVVPEESIREEHTFSSQSTNLESSSVKSEGLALEGWQRTPSQIIYRDQKGNPLIPEEVSKLMTGAPLDPSQLSETKLEFATTLKALQEHQKALAQARAELAARRKALAETNRAYLTETTRQTAQKSPPGSTVSSQFSWPADLPLPPSVEDISESEPDNKKKLLITQTQRLEEDPESTAFLDRGSKILATNQSTATNFVSESSHEPIGEDGLSEESINWSAERVKEEKYRPVFSPTGYFIPFSDEDFNRALIHEDQELLNLLTQVQTGPHCWSYHVFGLILEYHVNKFLPAVSWPQDCQNVFLGNTQKYLQELNQQFLVLLNILRRMLRPFGEPFEHNITYHDIVGWMEMVYEIDERMNEFYTFFQEFTQLALPHKDILLQIRSLIISIYDNLRWRLLDICDRLYKRSVLDPFSAQKGSISVSIIPPTIYQLNILLGNLVVV